MVPAVHEPGEERQASTGIRQYVSARQAALELRIDLDTELLDATEDVDGRDLAAARVLARSLAERFRTPGRVEQVQQAHPGCHLFVVIDTTSRAVHGEENAADTFQDFYRFTGIRLKRRQVTWVRLDHAGKDSGQGQRGSSAKGDDVDIVWKIDKADDGVVLKRELSRISWAKEKVSFAMTTEPLRYRRAIVYQAGTKECADLLDELGFPIDGSGNAAVKFLRDHKQGRAREVVQDAVRHRREQQR